MTIVAEQDKFQIMYTGHIDIARLIFSVFIFVLISSLPISAVQAFPFPVVDARTASLGGVSVASDVSTAPFSNPALVAQNVENTNWLLAFPSQANLKNPSDDFENNLAKGAGLQDGDKYREFESNSFAVVIPDDTFGGLIYYNDRLYHTAEITTNGTVVRHRAVNVQENGFALARTMAEPDLPLYGFMVGVNTKLVQYHAYGYDVAAITDPNVELNRSKYSTPSSAINFDLGMARELGVWKLGLVVKDIFSYEQTYGNSGDKYRVLPQTRIGFSYHSRNTFWEVDVDLSKNTEIATESETQLVAFGWEYRIIRPLAIRLGFNNNSVGDQLQTSSAGIGLNFSMFQLDFAQVKNENESGTFAQLTMKF